MMEEDKKDMGPGHMGPGPMDHSHCCGHCGAFGMCGMHGGHRHGLLRLLLGIVILLIVFWLGLKVGEFRGEFGRFGGYNGRQMVNYRPMMLWGAAGYPAGMMQATTTPVK
jgi:hypothetical protein